MKIIYNLLCDLVCAVSGNDVVLSMVDGRVLYRNGCFPAPDIECVRFEREKSSKRILAALKK